MPRIKFYARPFSKGGGEVYRERDPPGERVDYVCRCIDIYTGAREAFRSELYGTIIGYC